jgi:dTMP kinase
VKRKTGLFVVLEGPDKSGKSTQARRLVGALTARGVKVTRTREPGGTGVAESIRKVLLDPALTVCPTAELFLYEAARAQHADEVIRPALKAGHVVVCERWTMSTDVYQGAARGLGLAVTKTLNKIATGGLRPHATFVINIPDSEFAKRDQGRELDRLEREKDSFHAKVRKAYAAIAKKTPGAALIDGTRPEDDIHAELVARVERLLK